MLPYTSHQNNLVAVTGIDSTRTYLLHARIQRTVPYFIHTVLLFSKQINWLATN